MRKLKLKATLTVLKTEKGLRMANQMSAMRTRTETSQKTYAKSAYCSVPTIFITYVETTEVLVVVPDGSVRASSEGIFRKTPTVNPQVLTSVGII